MNRCSIDQDETTMAVTIQYLVPAPAIQGLQPVHPGGPPFSAELPYPDQRHQPFGPQAGVKKKHGTKDRSHEPKQERPSLSSNSTKKNLHTSNKTRSLNGANQSPLVNEVEFQDSGQSISLIAEKHRLKHKEKKKLRDKVVDEGISYEIYFDLFLYAEVAIMSHKWVIEFAFFFSLLISQMVKLELKRKWVKHCRKCIQMHKTS